MRERWSKNDVEVAVHSSVSLGEPEVGREPDHGLAGGVHAAGLAERGLGRDRRDLLLEREVGDKPVPLGAGAGWAGSRVHVQVRARACIEVGGSEGCTEGKRGERGWRGYGGATFKCACACVCGDVRGGGGCQSGRERGREG